MSLRALLRRLRDFCRMDSGPYKPWVYGDRLAGHDWQARQWTGDLDARECRRCGRFEVYAYGSFVRVDRRRFDSRDAGQ